MRLILETLRYMVSDILGNIGSKSNLVPVRYQTIIDLLTLYVLNFSEGK